MQVAEHGQTGLRRFSFLGGDRMYEVAHVLKINNKSGLESNFKTFVNL
jgi:hypothetical protein